MRDLSLSSWRAFAAVPRGRQRAAIEGWLAALPEEVTGEAWNARFGEGSLFDAWTRSTVVQGLHGANALRLRERLDTAGPGWRVLEIGGGDGRLWRRTLRPDDRGTLVVVDPMPEVHDVVSRALPDGVAVEQVVRGVEGALDALGADADAIVCSLTLHHVAGADAAERARHGLEGPGKLEILQALRGALRPEGLLILNEADIHCDLELAAGDPLLAERLIDSYVRRCALSLLRDAEHRADADADLRARWRSIVRHWCLGQIAYADVPVAERDVYELDVPRWLALLDRAGWRISARGFTDDVLLFHRYVCRPV